MAELSRVVVLLTDDPGSAMAAELYMPVVALPDLDSQFSTTTTALPDLVAALPEYEAYVIFTSGSTGVPKGVSVSRANLAYSTAARNAVYGTQRPRFLLLSPVGFDSAVAGLFWPLTTGGAVIIPTPAIEQSPHKLAQFIHQSGATMTLCVPSFYRLLVEQADAMHLQNLETVIVAGEACPPDVVRLHFERTPDTMLFNEYGPTECTVWSTFARLLPSVHEDHVPIGRPIPGATVRVLDAAGRPVPLGIAGELYVGGPGVARGYVDLPNETTERFVDDPLLTGARLYRTGDIVRMGNDGVLTFLGRNDSQIKIRGFRIERHEIEAALQRHSEIAEVVVVPHVPRPQESERPTDDGSVEELVACLNELHPTVAAELLRSCA
jgi:amino acid adenylation domain-containing protein